MKEVPGYSTQLVREMKTNGMGISGNFHILPNCPAAVRHGWSKRAKRAHPKDEHGVTVS